MKMNPPFTDWQADMSADPANFTPDESGFIARPVIEAMCHGDKEAFQSVYLHTYDKLKRYLRFLLGNLEDAEEAVQDIFLYLLENTDKIDPSKNFKGYLYTMAKNAAYKRILRRNYDNKYTDYRHSFAQDVGLSPEEYMMTDELALIISVYIDNMPAQRRRIFEMSRNEGKSIREIAEELNISQNTVKSHLQTAVHGLREFISVFALLFLAQQ